MGKKQSFQQQNQNQQFFQDQEQDFYLFFFQDQEKVENSSLSLSDGPSKSSSNQQVVLQNQNDPSSSNSKQNQAKNPTIIEPPKSISIFNQEQVKNHECLCVKNQLTDQFCYGQACSSYKTEQKCSLQIKCCKNCRQDSHQRTQKLKGSNLQKPAKLQKCLGKKIKKEKKETKQQTLGNQSKQRQKSQKIKKEKKRNNTQAIKCLCKNRKCQKRYCNCLKNNKLCTYRCQCQNCKNCERISKISDQDNKDFFNSQSSDNQSLGSQNEAQFEEANLQQIY